MKTECHLCKTVKLCMSKKKYLETEGIENFCVYTIREICYLLPTSLINK